MRINRRCRRAIDENEEMDLLAESGRFALDVAPRGLVRLISKDGKEIDAPLGTRTFVPNRIESNRVLLAGMRRVMPVVSNLFDPTTTNINACVKSSVLSA